jgi:iron complex transport system permease protein
VSAAGSPARRIPAGAAATRSTATLVAVSGVLLIASLALGLGLGSSGVTLGEAVAAARKLASGLPLSTDEQLAYTVLSTLRGPRVLVAALCGGALSAAGVVSQGLFRNGLASPSVLGTEAGGSLAAVLAFYVGAAYTHWLTLPLAAFAGALAATTFIFYGATRRARGSTETLLLAGFALNALLGAGTSLVVSLMLEDYQKAGAVMHWLLGGFAAAGWEHLRMGAAPAAAGLLLAWRLCPRLDVLALGEDVAATLSVDMRRLKGLAIVCVAALVGTSVSIAGALPFVGLVVPHLTRLAAGPAHRRLLGLSVLNGMSLVVLADLLARTIRAPGELEVGILTSLIGAPFFVAMLLGGAGDRAREGAN